MENKKILIVLPNALDPNSGGVERVYYNLTPFLKKIGYSVYATYSKESSWDTSHIYNESFLLNTQGSAKRYKDELKIFLNEHHFDYIINSWMDYNVVTYLSSLSNQRVIHHVHNIPSQYLYHSIGRMPSKLEGTIIDKVTRKIRFDIRLKSAFKNIKHNGQKIVILSESFRDDLNNIYRIDPENIVAIPNPLPLDNSFTLDPTIKEETLLYVGRINEDQKRFHSILNIWQILEKRLPNYQLKIVGGGPMKKHYEDQAKKMGLERITFYGFQSPKEFYEKSPISMMTSNYEGFGMVLVEAMQYGCIPFAFDTFTALHDIIDNGINGFIIKPFDEQKYAEKIIEVLNLDSSRRKELQENAINKSKKFDVAAIGKRWQLLLDNYL